MTVQKIKKMSKPKKEKPPQEFVTDQWMKENLFIFGEPTRLQYNGFGDTKTLHLPKKASSRKLKF